jgi:hypothetical protein
MLNTPIVSGYGRYHTNNPTSPIAKPFDSISYEEIAAIAINPLCTLKQNAQWVIFSTLRSRLKSEQMNHGQFTALTLDIDLNAPTLGDLEKEIKGLVIGGEFLIYTSKSASEINQKSHVLIPVNALLTGYRWKLCQMILNDKVEFLGIKPDRKVEDANQICYLPNRGEYYRCIRNQSGELFNPLKAWRGELFAKHKQVQSSKKQRLPSLAPRKGDSLIATFNNQYPITDILLQAGYDQKGKFYRHPNSGTGNYSASIKDGRVFTLSSNDPLFNTNAHNSFSAFVILFHDGDFEAALIDAGENWLQIGGVPWNKSKQMDFMRVKG